MNITNNKLRLLVLFLLSSTLNYAQKEKTSIDSLATEVIQNVYKERPEHLSNTDSSQTKRSSLKAYPYAFYTPESKLAFGAGGVYVFYTGDGEKLKPSKIGFGGYYSTNKQYKISMNNVYYFNNNKLYIELPLSYGFFINKYWGIGDNTQDIETASYSQRTFSGTITLQVPPVLFSADRTGIIIDFDNTEIVDIMENELLNDDSLPGADGATIVGFGTDLLWDSRNNIFYPNKGHYQYFRIIVYPDLGDYVFTTLQLDSRHYWALGSRSVLAGNFYLESALGDTPFYKLPAIGGKQMRGFFYGRYRDNFYSMVQLEYRHFFAKRWGFVTFGTLGNVASDILDYDFSNLKYSLGSGLRFKFNQKENINLRADFGIGTDGSTGIYFGIEEAF